MVFLEAGDLLVAPHDCYGGSYRLFDNRRNAAAVAGVVCRSKRRTGRWKQALAEKPKLVLVKKSKQSLLRVVDIAKNLSAHKRDAGSDKCSG